ncbi:MAG: hypothetical protein JJ866_19260 [Roseibium sp.]|uniref:hypothetical protein n=1 Tax=Roseibium sp. TaxID=1936156 RepID=UPI001B25F5D1|nr:hypothetical protein [Roseibium sp.]MBO6507608.1 hypothetical protein [Roseibium sp.]MBO6894088.1 hypothetical protein [Roseibium sp.]MBO6929708.1 hypothetical protein [Roseibium sp.]
MTEAIGQGTTQTFQPSLETSRVKQVAEQAEAIKARQSAAVADTVQRQANFSSNRAEFLSRQAEQLENRAQAQRQETGLGDRLDISI